MFYEALQMVHHNERVKIKSLSKNHKFNGSTTVINACPQPSVRQFRSSVAIHKLRESKWFNHSESNILCSVVESGFILEKRMKSGTGGSEWAVAYWKNGEGMYKNTKF